MVHKQKSAVGKNYKFTVCSILNLSYWTPNSAVFACAGNICTEWERLLSTTKCCVPARKSGKSENSPKAPSVIVGIEVDDAETIGKPQWDGIGPGFVWINRFRDYVVCQSTATCFRLFKHWGCFSLKLHRHEKKGRKPNLASTCWKCPPWRVAYGLESWHFVYTRKES